MEKIKVALLDDHHVIREAMREILSRQPGIEVIGDFGDPHEFIRNFESLIFDVLLLDIRMPGMDGHQVAARINKSSRPVKIVIFLMCDDDESIRQALKLKVSGYVLKDSCLADVLSAIRSAHNDQLFLSPAIAKRVVEQPAQLNRLKNNQFGLDLLTDREKDVLKLIAAGLRVKEVAGQLNIAIRTAETHKKNIMGKLDIHNSILLTRYAIQSSLIDLKKK